MWITAVSLHNIPTYPPVHSCICASHTASGARRSGTAAARKSHAVPPRGPPASTSSAVGGIVLALAQRGHDRLKRSAHCLFGSIAQCASGDISMATFVLGRCAKREAPHHDWQKAAFRFVCLQPGRLDNRSGHAGPAATLCCSAWRRPCLDRNVSLPSLSGADVGDARKRLARRHISAPQGIDHSSRSAQRPHDLADGPGNRFLVVGSFMVIVWFFVGVGFIIISILAGLFVGQAERGKIFGVLAINTSLGALVGGFVSGPIVEQWGYPVLFLAAALCWTLQPAIALLLQDKVLVRARREAVSTVPAPPAFGGAFYLLLLANVIAFAAGFVAVLGRPLLMDRLGFDLAAISGAVAVGGAISLPFPLLLGWLSDRLGRYWLIIVCFLTGALGLVLLAVSVSSWHFWAASILLAGVGVSLGIGPALVTDLVPQESLGRALAWYGFAPTTGGIIGFMLTGYAIETFGMTRTFVAGALLTLIAIALVVQVRRARQLAPA